MPSWFERYRTDRKLYPQYLKDQTAAAKRDPAVRQKYGKHTSMIGHDLEHGFLKKHGHPKESFQSWKRKRKHRQ